MLRCWPLALALLLGGCFGGDEPRTTTPPPRPATFAPEQFPDIPLPRGYMFSPEVEQLAVSVAGGMVRRFEVLMEERSDTSQQTPVALMQQMERLLLEAGWKLETSDTRNQSWRKDSERLLLETGRRSGRTTIRLRLRPTQAVGS